MLVRSLELRSFFTKAKRLFIGAGGGVALSLIATSALAGPYGYDLHNVLSPRAAGMAGTAIAGDNNGPVEAVYGNPANLVDFQGGTDFAFGATMYYPRATATLHNRPAPLPTLPAEGIRVTSGTEFFAIPQIAVTQDLAGVGVPVVLGLGFSAVSGIGVDFRRDPDTLGAGAEFIVLGINAGVGYQLTEDIDLGAAVTISYGMLEAGLAGTSGQGHDYGVRLTLGGEYDLTEDTEVGFYYQTELEHNWNNMLFVSNTPMSADGRYLTLEVQQPENVAVGISHQLTDNLRIAADYIYKNWSKASFWDRFYKDQSVISVGAEYELGSWTLRAGYAYNEDPTRDINGVAQDPLQGYDFICTGSGGFGACLPLTGDGALANYVWTWLQAMETPVVFNHRVTAGFTYEGFLAPFLTLDANVGHQLSADHTYSSSGNANHTTLDVQSYYAGFALTWSF